MGSQFKFSAALLCTALALQIIYMTTAAAAATARTRPGFPAAELEQLLQMFYDEQEREMAEVNEQEQEMAEINGLADIIKPKYWLGTNYDPITTPREYNVFALQVSSPDHDGKNNHACMHKKCCCFFLIAIATLMSLSMLRFLKR